MDAGPKKWIALHIRDQRTRVRTCTIHLMRTKCAPHTRPRRGVVITAPPTVRYSELILYAAIIITACEPPCSVFRNSKVVRYSGASIVLYIWRLQLVHATVSVIW